MTPYQVALKRLLNSGSMPKLGLERMFDIAGKLGNPERKFPSFHVAGTNGKGSTCAYVESILRHAGYRVGLYTSPHLTCVRERIQINRELISEEDFVDLEKRVPEDGTFFERMTAMAFLYFAEQKVEVAVIEVGLGGRLDATNIITPVVSGISRIDLDHQGILGNTIEEITREKMGIIKPGVPWVAQKIPLNPPFPKGEELPPFSKGGQGGFRVRGPDYQQENASLAAAMIKASGWQISDDVISKGIANMRWPCRYEFVRPNVLIDGAHNPGGMRALISALQADKLKPESLWVGMTEGHNGHEMAQIWTNAFPDARVYVGQSKSPRALPVHQVASFFPAPHVIPGRDPGSSIIGNLTPDPSPPSGEGKILVVTGSLYWAGQIRAKFIDMPVDEEFGFY